MNDVNLTGRITKDPDVRTTEKSQIVNFTLAVNREFSKEKECDFISCVAFNNQATFISKYITKGDLIGVHGRIQVRNYQSKNGDTVYVTEILCDRVEMLSKVQGHQQVNNQNQSTITHIHTREETVSISDDDLPF